EVGMVSVLAGPDYSIRHPELLSTAGRPVPGVEVAVCDGDGRALPTGVGGEIVVRSPGVCAATTRRPDPGFCDAHCRRTGDWGVLDAEGRLTVRGRISDAVPAADDLVFPVDVQEALCADPTVRYAVAIPAPSGGGFSAAVVLRPGSLSSAAELLRRTPAR